MKKRGKVKALDEELQSKYKTAFWYMYGQSLIYHLEVLLIVLISTFTQSPVDGITIILS